MTPDTPTLVPLRLVVNNLPTLTPRAACIPPAACLDVAVLVELLGSSTAGVIVDIRGLWWEREKQQHEGPGSLFRLLCVCCLSSLLPTQHGDRY